MFLPKGLSSLLSLGDRSHSKNEVRKVEIEKDAGALETDPDIAARDNDSLAIETG